MSNWTTISGHLQGDISYSLRKVLVTPVYVDFELTTFGQKWTECDIAFEYRLNNKENWKEDAVISQTTAKYLKDNKLYGLTASKDGITHTIQWKYSENELFYSNTAQIRIRPLPRIRVFGSSGHYYPISSAYGDSLVDLDGMSRHACIGIDNSGRYMCVGAEVFYVIDSLDVEEFTSSSTSSSSSETSSSSSSISSCAGIGCMIIEGLFKPFTVS